MGERQNCLNGSEGEGALRKGKNEDAQDNKTQSLTPNPNAAPHDRSVLHGGTTIKIIESCIASVSASVYYYIYWISLTSFWCTITASSSLLTLLEDDDSGLSSFTSLASSSSDPTPPGASELF